MTTKPSHSTSRTASSGSTSTSASASASTSALKPAVAPIFRMTSSTGNTTTNTNPFADPRSSSASLTSTTTAPPKPPSTPFPPPRNSKKRSLPWENLTPTTLNSTSHSKKKTHSLRSTSSSSLSSKNFANLPSTSYGPHHHHPATSGKGMSAKALLTSESMNIKQKVVLSPEQQRVLKLVVEEGKNVFFTGSAGTGKSVLLREIIASLRVKHNASRHPDSVVVTASTGMAACNIGGTTIHSFAGIGLGHDAVDALVQKVKKQRTAKGRWEKCKVLVIDEVSMLDGILFDKLAGIANQIKKNHNGRFGGIQLVVTGDFFQLPPVVKGTSSPTFAFQARSWKDDIDVVVNLTQVFRQKSTEFIDMLNEMRFGAMSSASVAKFQELKRELPFDDGVDPTELFPRREEVEKANNLRLAQLRSNPTTYRSEDYPRKDPGAPPAFTDSILSHFMAPEKLVLKVGAQVMLIKNLDTVLVNGTVGKVVGFGGVDDDDGEESLLDDGEDKEGEGGGEGGDVKKKEEDKVVARKKLKLAQAVGRGEAQLSPVVEWNTANGKEKRLMAREEFKVEDAMGRKVASRKQFPLILAWAMSIHKSQGQTLPKVKVDLGKVFEKGQSYVALSRATSLDGLQVLGFDPKKVLAHPRVVEWSKTLAQA